MFFFPCFAACVLSEFVETTDAGRSGQQQLESIARAPNLTIPICITRTFRFGLRTALDYISNGRFPVSLFRFVHSELLRRPKSSHICLLREGSCDFSYAPRSLVQPVGLPQRHQRAIAPQPRRFETMLMPLHVSDTFFLSFEKNAVPVAKERGLGILVRSSGAPICCARSVWRIA